MPKGFVNTVLFYSEEANINYPGPDSDHTEQGKQKEETLRFSLTSNIDDVVELGVLCWPACFCLLLFYPALFSWFLSVS